MEQEHRITYKAGITRNPSDFLCGDGELAECINLATDSEELKPVVQPAVHIASAVDMGGVSMKVPEIVYVHKFNDEDRYIGHLTSGGLRQLCWGTVEDSVYSLKEMFMPNNAALYYDPGMSFSSVGKVLIITIPNNAIKYFIYKPTKYDYYSDILAPDISFKLTDYKVMKDGRKNYRSLIFDTNGAWGDARGESRQHGVAVGKQAEFNDIILGAYYNLVKDASRKKAFSRPFLVRYALEMYDGSFYHISQPIAMFPSVTRNCWLQNIDADGVNYSTDEFKMYLKACLLWYKSNKNLSEFSDLVKNVSVFVTSEIEINDVVSDQYLDNFTNNVQYDTISEASDTLVADQSTYRVSLVQSDLQHPERTAWRAVKERETHSVMEDIASASIFYKIAEIGLEETEEYNTFDFDEHKIENITTQEFLEEDDFYSRCSMHPSYQYSYNSRLNVANVTRGFFEGFDFFMPYDNTSANTYTAYVKIITDEGDYWIEHQYTTKQKQGIYFYYPDSRASHVTIFKGSDCVCDAKLTEHKGLNGAYYLNKYPVSFSGHTIPSFVDETVVSSTTTDFHPNNHQNNNGDTERLSNYIIQSEVNNPWVFRAMGYFKVGTGRIIGMSTITQALSQGQFGQYPLLVFSESGIWALSVGSEGYYTAIHPMSRDVCINKNSIIQTDGAVFFVSKKGLMVVAGGDVNCVSVRMNGATFDTSVLTGIAGDTDWEDIVEACQDSTSFLDYIRNENLIMAYDYIDSRIVMTKPGAGYSFVYNMADGTISKVILPAAMTGAVNNYPDYLMQGTVWEKGGTPLDPVMVIKKKVFSFYGKQREEEVADRQLGFLLTRPMKLAGPVSKTSLRQLMNVGMWNKAGGSAVKTEIYLSDDLQTWYPDISRFGAAAKYYRLALYVKMLPTERISGTILTEQPRRTNNVR